MAQGTTAAVDRGVSGREAVAAQEDSWRDG